jgi:hypothetical protein
MAKGSKWNVSKVRFWMAKTFLDDSLPSMTTDDNPSCHHYFLIKIYHKGTAI